ncbi:MAG TPA: DUF896 domain-containing protein [Candidatus Deferrimicrobium sp.]|nr:DUF896 domain-containing protein [Candidatus Deferrimicrobium sp.]
MITKELIKQINSLYHKSQDGGLTEQEKQLQATLRQEYLKGIRAQMKNTLDNVTIVDDEHPVKGECGCGKTHKH